MYKTALITGASSGIGAAIAKQFAENGISLVLIARRKERLEQVASELSSLTDCHLITADVCDQVTIKNAVNNLPEKFKSIDILVNNAGLALGLAAAHASEWADWQQMINTNCTALAYITNLILPKMVERNRGHVVNIGSIAGTYPYPNGNVYAATKAFVEQFSLGLKTDLIGTAVRVTNIEPGLVGGTEFSLVRFKGDKERADKSYEGCIALNPESIAEAVYWAVSRPDYVNINRIEIMPVCQAPAGLVVKRDL